MTRIAIIGGALALAFYLVAGDYIAGSASDLVSKRNHRIEQALR